MTQQQTTFINRTLILSDTVDQGSVKDLIYKITSYNMYDDHMEATTIGYQRQSIVLIVNSYGGSVYDGFGLIAAMEMSATPIITVCLGSAMSMGFAIFVAGHTRIAHELSTFMYHEIWSGNFGKLTEQKIAMEEMERLQLQYDMYVLGRTKLSEERVNEVKKNKDDWFMDSYEAKKHGIVDLVVSEPVYWTATASE